MSWPDAISSLLADFHKQHAAALQHLQVTLRKEDPSKMVNRALLEAYRESCTKSATLADPAFREAWSEFCKRLEAELETRLGRND